MQHVSSTPQGKEERKATRKPYHSPQVREHGTLQEIALTTGIGPVDDGGGYTYYS